MKKAILTCSLNGVLTDPEKFKVPVTPKEMASSAKEAYDAGAAIVHIHFRDQRVGKRHLPSWDPDVAEACVTAIRDACPEILINMSTGISGPDISEPVSCLARVRPEMAAMNAGSLNYLRTNSKGQWAWPPFLFDNPVEKIEGFLKAMEENSVTPECECFDTGIVRSIRMFRETGLLKGDIHCSFVMGVASGMPAKANWLPLIVDELDQDIHWQTIAIGRQEVWEVHQKTIELGGNLRVGLEDTFYLPDGSRTDSNGKLVEALASLAKKHGRELMSPQECRELLRKN